MFNSEFAILTTTINVPTFLDNICKNIKKFKHKDFFFLVIADKKTPKGAKKYCKKIEKKFKVKIVYLDVNDQNIFFKKKYAKIYSLFPFNDAHRRLLGLIFIRKFKPKEYPFTAEKICMDYQKPGLLGLCKDLLSYQKDSSNNNLQLPNINESLKIMQWLKNVYQ